MPTLHCLGDRERRRGAECLPLVAALLFASNLVSAHVPARPYLSAKVAMEIAQGALASCEAHGFIVTVAVVDGNGVIRLLIAPDGAFAIDIDAARRKAITAAALNATTLDLVSRVASAPAYKDLLLTLVHDVLFAGGGVPIRADGMLLGAIGVGGAPGGDKDDACAQAGIQSAHSLRD